MRNTKEEEKRNSNRRCLQMRLCREAKRKERMSPVALVVYTSTKKPINVNFNDEPTHRVRTASDHVLKIRANVIAAATTNTSQNGTHNCSVSVTIINEAVSIPLPASTRHFPVIPQTPPTVIIMAAGSSDKSSSHRQHIVLFY